jgi:uncharacterized protein (TIGR03067 family)
MHHRVFGCLLLTLALANCRSVPRARPSLVGRWAPVSAELAGQPFPVANFAGATLQLTGDSYDFAGDKGTYSLLGGHSPAAMDIHGREGPNAGRTIPAIYALTGDSLTIGYQLGAGERPAAFASPVGSHVLLVRYQRAP